MGIPRFYKTWVKRLPYPNVVLTYVPEFIHTLSIDMNGLLHSSAQFCYCYMSEKDVENFPEEKKRAYQARKAYIQTASPQELEKDYHKIVSNMILQVLNYVQPREALILAVDGTAPLAKIKQQRQRRYRSAQERPPNMVFDSNSITSGTDFMARLDIYLTKWIKDNQLSLPPLVIYSNHLVRGEGEHKIMDIYRSRPEFQRPEKAHAMYGLDADLIVLSMLSPVYNVYLVREDTGDVVNIEAIKNGLYHYMNRKSSYLVDFCVLMTLVGNDFLPGVVSLSDMTHALNEMLKVYKRINKSLTTSDLKIDWRNLGSFLSYIANMENDLFVSLSYKQQDYPLTILKETMDPQSHQINMKELSQRWYNYILSPPPNKEIEVFSHLMNTDTPFGLNEENFNDLVNSYLGGMAWVLRYYTRGPSHVSESYYYPYFHAPLLRELADLAKQLDDESVKGDYLPNKNDPIKFFIPHQLLSVLPPKSIKLIPAQLRVYVQDTFSPVRDLFPDKFIIDMEGSKHGNALVPFVDPLRIIDAVSKINFNDAQRKYYFENGKDIVIIRKPFLVNKETLIAPVINEPKKEFNKKLSGGPVGSPVKVWDKVYKTPSKSSPSSSITTTTITLSKKQVMDEVANLVRKPDYKSFKQLYVNPTQLTKYLYKKLLGSIQHSIVLSKTDGEHVFMYNKNMKKYIINNTLFKIEDSSIKEEYLLEGEYLPEKNKFIVFDAIVVGDKNVFDLPYKEVLSYLTNLPKELNAEVKESITVGSNPSDVYQKNKSTLNQMMEEGDGLIIYRTNKDDSNYRERKIYKWKPEKYLTIDFFCKEVEGGYYLFNYIHKSMRNKVGIRQLPDYEFLFPRISTINVPIQFSPMALPDAYFFETDIPNLDNKVVELLFDVSTSKWNYIRTREDKQKDAESQAGLYGNYISIAEQTFVELFDPLTLDQLFSNQSIQSYFLETTNNPPMYNSIRLANTMFKNYWFNKYSQNVNLLVDLAAGQGSDIKKYRDHKINNVIMVDQDLMALNEVVLRKYNPEFAKKVVFDTNIYYNLFDLSSSYEEYQDTLDLFPVKEKADSVSCQMAIHYFTPTIKNFIEIVKSSLKEGGYFFYTCFDGKKLFNLLKEYNGNYEVIDQQSGEIKYKLMANYDVKKTKTYNPEKKLLYIKVLLPFSSKELYMEPLVDIDWLNNQFISNGFEFIEMKSNIEVVDSIQEEDRFYASLYSGSCLRLK